LAKLFVSFLTKHVNIGVYSGVSAADLTLVMRLDLALQLSYVFINGVVGGKNVFKALLETGDLFFLDELVSWMFLNFSSNKSKTSPVGSRIYLLSSNVESLMAMIGDT
jgi:hypothetical protein